MKTFVFSFVLLLLNSTALLAQTPDVSKDSLQAVRQDSAIRVIRAPKSDVDSVKAESFFSGVAVGFDLCGAIMAVATPYGQYEVFGRASIKDRFFPILEFGIGTSNHTNEESNLHYKVNAPYFRVGCDYNFLKDRRSGNRIFAGLRYGLSYFKYDLDGSDLTDPVYGTTQPFSYTGLKGAMHWGEAVAGVETRIWRIFHLGWTVRYRLRFHEKQSEVGHAWYVPGYGKSDGHALGGTFNVVIDI